MTDLPAAERPKFRFVVEEGKVREFAAAVGMADTPGIPLTFPISAALWMAPEHSAWFGVVRDYRRVHAEQSFEYLRPLRIGQELVGQQRFGYSKTKTGRRGGEMTFTEIVTAFADATNNEPVVEMRQVIATFAPRSGAASIKPTKPQDSSDTAVPSGWQLVGEDTAEPFTLTDFVRYQGASGDFNPVHHDQAAAQNAGFQGVIAVGMLAAGRAAGMLTEHFGADRLGVTRFRFNATAGVGDALSYQILQDTMDEVRVIARRPDGGIHVDARSTLRT